MGEGKRRLGALAERYKYVLLVAAAGLALMLWPSGGNRDDGAAAAVTEEARLESLLSDIVGVGRAQVLLSDKGAAIVCQGADSATTRLAVTDAVRCYTGLGADQIVIFKSSETWREEH